MAVIPEEYESWSDVSFTADGRQVVYIANTKTSQFVVAASPEGGSTSPAYERVSWMQSSLDGKRFAFGGERAGKKLLVVDNKEVPAFSHQEIAPETVTPDGRYFAGEAGGFREKKWFVFISDGEKVNYRSQAHSSTFRPPFFSPDGRFLVYELGDDREKVKNLKTTIFFYDVPNGRIAAQKTFTDTWTGHFSFSSDSSRVVYNVQKDGKMFFIMHDFELNRERTVEPAGADRVVDIKLAPDGEHVIYTGSSEGKKYVIVVPWTAPGQGKKSRPYDDIQPPVFGPDKTTVAYLAMRAGKWLSVVGDSEGPANFDGVGDAAPVFSFDGKRTAFAARKGGQLTKIGLIDAKWMVVVTTTGKASAVGKGPLYDMAVSPVFSPDGRRIAYRARRGPKEEAKRFIVVADAATGKVIKEGPIGDEIWPPVWSADGRTLGYGARVGRELWWRSEVMP